VIRMGVGLDHPEVSRRAAVIVAHPDDEVLWAGGTILARPMWIWRIVSLCRGADPDRAPRFQRVLAELGATGRIGDLDDGPEQRPLPEHEVAEAAASLLDEHSFDVVLTHGPRGEYTRHRRHEEVCRAVVRLWADGRIETRTLWMFAFEDGGRSHLPRAMADAPLRERLTEEVWLEKRRLMTALYGFAAESWEARATPREEAYWSFDDPAAASAWVAAQGVES